MSASLAVYGGRFDPFHKLHLAVVRQAAAELPVARVLVIPNGAPPHQRAVAGWEHRMAMAQLGCAAAGAGEVAALEPAGGEPARTIDTLGRLPEHRGAPILIVGGDQFAALDGWWRWRELLAAVNWAVVPRAEMDWMPAQPQLAQLVRAAQVRTCAELGQGAGRIWAWPAPLGDTAAAEIRRRIGARDASWGELVPAAVASYIRTHRLYRGAR